MSGADDGTAESYCLCGSADDGRLMLECSANAAGCGGWVHPDCFDMTPSQVAAAEASDQWVCPLCCGDVKDEAAARTRARAVTEQYRASNSNVAPLSTSAAGDVDQPEDDFDEPDDMDDDDDSEDGAPKKRARGRGAGRGRKPAEGTTSKRGGSVSRRGRKPKSAMVVTDPAARRAGLGLRAASAKKSYAEDDDLPSDVDMYGLEVEEEEPEDFDDEEDDHKKKGRKKRRRRMNKVSTAAPLNEQPLIEKILGRRWVVPVQDPLVTPPKPPPHKPLRATGVDLTLWQFLGGKLASSPSSSSQDEEEEDEEEVDELVVNEPHWEYFIKWRGRAYIHCEWLTAAEIEADAPPEGKKRLARYHRVMEEEYGRVIPGREAEAATGANELGEFLDPVLMEVDRILDATHTEDGYKETDVRITWKKEAEIILKRLLTLRRNGTLFCEVFMQPVDPDMDGAPDYFDVIKRPMDLGTVKNHLYSGYYRSHEEFAADVRQVFINCALYNADPENEVRYMGDTLAETFEQKYAEFLRQESEQKEMEARGELLASDDTPQFLVKWKQSSYTEATWEPANELEDEVIADFYSRNRPPLGQKPAMRTYPVSYRPTQVYKASPTFGNNRVLRDYQVEGLNWLVNNWRRNANCILADEMGLGKTAQTVCFLNHLYKFENDPGPFLVVAPLSTLPHWQREVETWTGMSAIVYHDTSGRAGRDLIRMYEWHYEQIKPNGVRVPLKNTVKFTVLITSYETLLADAEEISKIRWSVVIVDEGQRLKNRKASVLAALGTLNIRRRVLLSGTPLQNNTEELWSLMNFVEPVKFNSLTDFQKSFGDIQSAGQVEKLAAAIKPYILRRLKEDVEKSIPKKEETIIDVELTMIQKQYYRAIFERNREFLCRPVGAEGKVRGPRLLNLESQLRKIGMVCHTDVEDREAAQGRDLLHLLTVSSGKMVLLDKLLPKLQAEGHKVLIFSQMTTMLDILQRFLAARGFTYERIDGTIRGQDRQAAIDRFSAPGSDRFVFLLSTRAGGVGINLTAADTVIIYDSDWNPQNDIQAQARAHRIGQTEEVKVYRLITRKTYEAVMFEKASMKLGLEQAVLGRARDKGPSKDEVEALLKRGAYGTLRDEDEANEAAKRFCEADINELLARGSRVVQLAEGGREEEDEGRLSALNFSKTSFQVTEEGEASVDFNDPEFWSKVLGQDARETLLQRLKDPDALNTESEKEAFLQEVFAAAQHIINQKLDGNPQPPHLDEIMAVLVEISAMKRRFSNSQRDEARSMLEEVERPKRKRRTLVDLPAAGATFPQGGTSRPRLAGDSDAGSFIFDSEDENVSKKSSKRREDDAGEEGGEGKRKRDGNWPVCALCLDGGDLLCCDGGCLRSFHLECLGMTQEQVSAQETSEGKWHCPDCRAGVHRCRVCGVAGPVGTVSESAPDGGAEEENSDDDGRDEPVEPAAPKSELVPQSAPVATSDDVKPPSDDTDAVEKPAEVDDMQNGRRFPKLRQLAVKELPKATAALPSVYKCRMGSCGVFYHLECVKKHPLTNTTGMKKATKFRCPQHYCNICGSSGDSSALNVCFLCPNSVHVKCWLKDTSLMWRFDRRFGLCPSHEEAKEVGKTFRFGLRERKSKKPKEPKEPKERKPRKEREPRKERSKDRKRGEKKEKSEKKDKKRKRGESKSGRRHVDSEDDLEVQSGSGDSEHDEDVASSEPEELASDASDEPKRKPRARKRSTAAGPKGEVSYPKEDIPPEFYDTYDGMWCRYCGARESSGWNASPWGSNLLCVVHYVAWKQKKTLSLPDELPTRPIAPEENTEWKYRHTVANRVGTLAAGDPAGSSLVLTNDPYARKFPDSGRRKSDDPSAKKKAKSKKKKQSSDSESGASESEE